jgi:hypothetical protein
MSTGRSVLEMSRVDNLRNKNLLLRTTRGTRPHLAYHSGADLDTGDVLFQLAASVPMLMELVYLVRNTDQPLRSDQIFGNTLLIESSKPFFWKGENRNSVNCRIRVLALAGEIQKGMRTLRTAQEDEVMATAHGDFGESELVPVLEKSYALLEQYRSMKRFSLCHQSPWVAGGDMSAILANAQLPGMEFIRNQGMFGYSLHMYNTLAELGTINRIEPLEALCDIFTQEVFLGSRPKKNYSNFLFPFNSTSAKQTEMLRRGKLTKSRMSSMHKTTEARLDPFKVSVSINQFY